MNEMSYLLQAENRFPRLPFQIAIYLYDNAFNTVRIVKGEKICIDEMITIIPTNRQIIIEQLKRKIANG